MAKKKKTKKKNLNNNNKEIILYSSAFIMIALLIVGLFKLGIGGSSINLFFKDIFGEIVHIVVIGQLIIYFSYVLGQGTFLKLRSRYVIGSIIFILGVSLLLAYWYLPKDIGLKIIDFKHLNESKIGLIQMFIYGGLSQLFGRIGTLIFGIVLVMIGIMIYFMISISTLVKKQHQNIIQISQDTSNNIKSIIKKREAKKKIFINDYAESKIVKKEDKNNIMVDNNHHEELVIEDINDNLPFEMDDNIFDNEDEVYDLDNLKNNKINDITDYQVPSRDLLNKALKSDGSNANLKYAQDKADTLVKFLKNFNLDVKVNNINIGSSITKFEVILSAGTRVNRLVNLADDIKMALAVKQLRIEAPIPGLSAIGIEIPNQKNTIVTLKEVLDDIDYQKENKLVFALGKDITGKSVYSSLDKMPHLLVAGTTGSGKSVCINSIIISLLLNANYEEVKLLLIDPKKVELGIYNGIPHLLTAVVNDPKKASVALKKVVEEMDERYQIIAQYNCKSIESYNDYVEKFNTKIANEELKLTKLPYIVVIIDELADLMMVSPKDVEECIMRITQMARAAGIYLIVATQRPSTDVITGIIKANIPSRIAFAVSSSIDSRTILDMIGAEKLLGKGDMLFSPLGVNSPVRIQGTFLSDREVNKVVYAIKKQMVINEPEENKFQDLSSATIATVESSDELYDEALEFVKSQTTISTSLLQRRFKIGYNRAATLIETLENNGYVSSANGSKPRDVLYKKEDD
ncbi:MAG: DNA translocase FtsK [Bacilli bacterium]|jgi:S-DNA-T family DNA segregation ATPase FtsK/SpoIIIE|nr:DNA translocase FtsK [Bacilli bacterium]